MDRPTGLSGADLRASRARLGWTQVRAAARLGISQAYLSLLERGRRPMSDRLLPRLCRTYGLQLGALPLVPGFAPDPTQLAAAIGGLGHPGFSYLRGRRRLNPAQVLLAALQSERLEARVAAALPWLVVEYAALDWEWVMERAKLSDRQNRLGFVVSLGREVASRRGATDAAARLAEVERRLERARLVREEPFGQSFMSEAERQWIRSHRLEAADHWGLLTDLRPEDVTDAA
jgi:transcriptional regulator with XRE-family HTH domain